MRPAAAAKRSPAAGAAGGRPYDTGIRFPAKELHCARGEMET
ncbi:MAG TPA: hypothetical protein VMP01_09835 [Pirellulaceae bacterium]|nr:hypothetical protein [Pirellulaceae bacterium]